MGIAEKIKIKFKKVEGRSIGSHAIKRSSLGAATLKASAACEKNSHFTIRSKLLIKEKGNDAKSKMGKGFSAFTMRSDLDEPEQLPAEDWTVHITRGHYIRRIYLHVAELLAVHLGLCCLVYYIAGIHHSWVKLVLIFLITTLLAFAASFFAYFIKWDLTTLFKIKFIVALGIVLLLGATPYIIHDSFITRTVFETFVCIEDLLLLAMTTQMVLDGPNRANTFQIERTSVLAAFTIYVEILVIFFFLPYLKIININ